MGRNLNKNKQYPSRGLNSDDLGNGKKRKKEAKVKISKYTYTAQTWGDKIRLISFYAFVELAHYGRVMPTKE